MLNLIVVFGPFATAGPFYATHAVVLWAVRRTGGPRAPRHGAEGKRADRAAACPCRAALVTIQPTPEAIVAMAAGGISGHSYSIKSDGLH